MNIQQVAAIVKQAGEMFKNRDFDVDIKTSISDKVTSMDIAVEAFLKDQLTTLFENSGFLGEESDPHALDNEYVWVVDPIDGTANFVRDLMTSCVAVALLKDQKAVMGVVYNPYRDEMFTAELGKGAFLNGKPIKVSDHPFSEGMFFTSLAPYNKHDLQLSLSIIEEVYPQSDDMRRFGSAEIELCLLACGRADLYFEVKLNPWDYAAGGLILTEAGGYIGIPHAESMTYDRPTAILAANRKENFEQLKEIVERHMSDN